MRRLTAGVLAFVCGLALQAGEIVYQFSNEDPQLKTYSIPNDQPVTGVKALSKPITGKSFTQEFDIEFGKLEQGGYINVGTKGLYIFFCRSAGSTNFGKTIRVRDSKLKYIASKDFMSYARGDDFHIKIIYNNADLQVQCIVTNNRSGNVVWDSGKKMCSPLNVQKLLFTVRGKKEKASAPFSTIEWDKNKKKLKLCSAPGGSIQFVAWVNNMKLTLND
jgi:hypothetical protein